MNASYFEDKKILFFDTETTGLANHKKPDTDPCQPNAVQIGAMTSIGRRPVTSMSFVVQTGGLDIHPKAEETHGISKSFADAHGFSQPVMVSIFNNMAKWADIIVCHNNSFDVRVIHAAYHRCERDFSPVAQADKVCTMKSLTNVLKIPGPYGFKWPTLQEAYKALVDEKGFEGAHDAFADIKATSEVFWAALDKGIEFPVSQRW